MPRPKKEVTEETAARELELESMNFRCERHILDRVEKRWRLDLYRNRTQWITEAIEEKLEGVTCPSCGAHNPKGGRICSVCLRPLTAKDAVNMIVNVTPAPEKKPATQKTRGKKSNSS